LHIAICDIINYFKTVGHLRQKIADGWPASIDDSSAREDWGWNHQFDLEKMTVDMLEHLSEK
jgi:nucleoside-diphosphate-sugar epimerase